MQWRFWAVAGEALNFGGRHMGTIVRMAWLPVLVVLMLHFATTFLVLSIIVEQPIRMDDVGSFAAAEAALPRFLAQYAALSIAGGSIEGLLQIALIYGVKYALMFVVIASAIVPLIRYAATGERPMHGLVHLPFGHGEVRFCLTALATGIIPLALVFVPFVVAVGSVGAIMMEVLKTEAFVSFPNDESIHTIRLTEISDILFSGERITLAGRSIPAILFAIPLWAAGLGVMILHFLGHRTPAQNPDGRARYLPGWLVALLIFVLAGVVPFLIAAGKIAVPELVHRVIPRIPETLVPAAAIFVPVFLLLGYVSLRLFAWPGYAVVNRSFSLKETFAVSRGFNLYRIVGLMALVIVALWAVHLVAGLFLSAVFYPALLMVFQMLVQGTRLLNSGVTGEWVVPVVLWSWNIVRLLMTIFLSFFTYGVIAGVYGKLVARARAPYMPVR